MYAKGQEAPQDYKDTVKWYCLSAEQGHERAQLNLDNYTRRFFKIIIRMTTMQKYLFGLGTMLVGAGLMFVMMHGEVSAKGEPKKLEPFVVLNS